MPDNKPIIIVLGIVVLAIVGLVAFFMMSSDEAEPLAQREIAIPSPPPEPVPELTEDELERFQFEIEEAPVTVKDLSLGQRYALSTQRREMEDLIARRLGILRLKGDASDLKILQSLIERKVMRSADVRQWQGMGMVFVQRGAADFFQLAEMAAEPFLIGFTQLLAREHQDDVVAPGLAQGRHGVRP